MNHLSLYKIKSSISNSIYLPASSTMKNISLRYTSTLSARINIKPKMKYNLSFLFTRSNHYTTYTTQSSSTRRSSISTSNTKIDVEDWTNKNYTPYAGDASFLAGPTEKTRKLLKKANEYLAKERANNNLYDIDSHIPSTITSHPPGYMDKENEVIYGYQTDTPLKRSIKPFGGINMIKNALKVCNIPMDKEVETIFTNYRKTHHSAVFDIYSKEMRLCRSNAIITSLPEGFGRGRIIGDYRRVALYGTDHLIAQKEKDIINIQNRHMDEPTMKLIGEIADQIKALKQLNEMAKSYGIDISKPAKNAKEATQFLYFGYLGSIKEQNSTTMTFGRVDAFLDCYFEKDLKNGVITEAQAQEIIDNLVLKLRFVRHLCNPEYNDLFIGDQTWVTLLIGGMGMDGRFLVTKTSFRILNSLYNLGSTPQPNIIVLWNKELPKNFKNFAIKVSIDTSSIQYEYDTSLFSNFNDEDNATYCVSPTNIGNDIQLYGGRFNLPKLMLYILNHGKDERTGLQVSPDFGPVPEGPIPFDWMWKTFDNAMEWITKLYVNTMNVIHFCHDQYCYESLQMALNNTEVRRFMAFGVVGISVVADSFSAIKYAKVTPIRDAKTGLTVDFKIEGEFPIFGNCDHRIDSLAHTIMEKLYTKLTKLPTYRHAIHNLSVQTIASNMIFGKKTGSTPNGRRAGKPFTQDHPSLNDNEFTRMSSSISSIAHCIKNENYMYGVSNTFSIIPDTNENILEKCKCISDLFDEYFNRGIHHFNINVINPKVLEDAINHPEKYSNLIIHISGYAIHFVKIPPFQQKEILNHILHNKI